MDGTSFQREGYSGNIKMTCNGSSRRVSLESDNLKNPKSIFHFFFSFLVSQLVVSQTLLGESSRLTI